MGKISLDWIRQFPILTQQGVQIEMISLVLFAFLYGNGHLCGLTNVLQIAGSKKLFKNVSVIKNT